MVSARTKPLVGAGCGAEARREPVPGRYQLGVFNLRNACKSYVLVGVAYRVGVAVYECLLERKPSGEPALADGKSFVVMVFACVCKVAVRQ